MQVRLIPMLVISSGLLLLEGCGERRVLPDSAYEPPKSKAQIQKEAEEEEREALAAVPKVKTIGEKRTWSTPDGTSQIEGEMISLQDGYVDILRPTGEITAIPIGRLCKEDQQYAKEPAAKASAGQTPHGDEKK